MSKITSHPPKRSLQEFILDAERKNNKENAIVEAKTLPWEDENIRADVQKVFTVKLPEEYILKIKYASDSTNKSQQKIVREIIQQGIDAFLQKIS